MNLGLGLRRSDERLCRRDPASPLGAGRGEAIGLDALDDLGGARIALVALQQKREAILWPTTSGSGIEIEPAPDEWDELIEEVAEHGQDH